MKSLNEIVAELRMGDDGGKPAYRIGRADKVEVSMPSGTPVRSYVIECVTIKELADWIEAAAVRERGPCNAAAMREALASVTGVLEEILDSFERGTGGVPKFKVRDVIEKGNAALSAPARNCDRFADAEAARQAWLYDAENWDEFGSPELELHEWLLAPASERKGDGDVHL